MVMVWGGMENCREKSRAKWEEKKIVALEIFSGSVDPKWCWCFSLSWVIVFFFPSLSEHEEGDDNDDDDEEEEEWEKENLAVCDLVLFLRFYSFSRRII